jgi:ATP-binding cassette, subfamily B, bacterial
MKITKANYHTAAVFLRLMKMLLTDRLLAGLGFWLVIVIQGALPAINIVLMARLFKAGADYISNRMELHLFLEAALLFVIVQLLQKYLSRILHIWFMAFQRLLVASLDLRVFEKIERIRLERFEDASFHDHYSRAYDVISSGRFLDMMRRSAAAVQEIITVIAMVGVISYFSSWLAVSLIVAALPIAVLRLIRGKQFWQMRWFQSSKERMANYVMSILVGRETAKELRVFETRHFFIHRWRSLREELLQERWKFEKKNMFLELFLSSATTEIIAYVIGIVIIVNAAMTGRIDISVLAATIISLRTFQDKVRYSFIHIVAASNAARFVADLFRFIDDPEEENVHSSLKPPVPLQSGIRLENVSFQYPGRDVPVIDNLTLHLKPGEKIALVGVNGAGKSTLIKLILGMLRPTSGTITYDHMDVQELNPSELRASLSVVFQDYVKYQYLLEDNIRFGDILRSNHNEILTNAAAQSGVAEFAHKLPEGYKTRLGKQFNDATDLSGGQWQRIATARGYMREPQVLVMDEPTSALDPMREAEVYYQFVKLAKGKISIMVSHRLGSCRLADRILVLSNGSLAEIGSHDELMSRNGVYANMYREQAYWYGG